MSDELLIKVGEFEITSGIIAICDYPIIESSQIQLSIENVKNGTWIASLMRIDQCNIYMLLHHGESSTNIEELEGRVEAIAVGEYEYIPILDESIVPFDRSEDLEDEVEWQATSNIQAGIVFGKGLAVRPAIIETTISVHIISEINGQVVGIEFRFDEEEYSTIIGG